MVGGFEFTGAYAPSSASLESFTAENLIDAFAGSLEGRATQVASESRVNLYFGPLTQIQVSMEFLHFPLPMKWQVVLSALHTLVDILRVQWVRVGRSTFETAIKYFGLPFMILTVGQEQGLKTIFAGETLVSEGRRFRNRPLPHRWANTIFDSVIADLEALVRLYPIGPKVSNGYHLDRNEGSVRMTCHLSSETAWPDFAAADLLKLFKDIKSAFFEQNRFEGFGLTVVYNHVTRGRIMIGHIWMNQEYFAPPAGLKDSPMVSANDTRLGETDVDPSYWNASSTGVADQMNQSEGNDTLANVFSGDILSNNLTAHSPVVSVS